MIFHVPEALAQEFPCFLICQVTNPFDLHPGPQAAFPDCKSKKVVKVFGFNSSSFNNSCSLCCNRVLFLLDHFYNIRQEVFPRGLSNQNFWRGAVRSLGCFFSEKIEVSKMLLSFSFWLKLFMYVSKGFWLNSRLSQISTSGGINNP